MQGIFSSKSAITFLKEFFSAIDNKKNDINWMHLSIFVLYKIFQAACKTFQTLFQILSNRCNQNFIFVIFYSDNEFFMVTLERFNMQLMFLMR